MHVMDKRCDFYRHSNGFHELNLGPIKYELGSKKVIDSLMSRKHDATEFEAIIQNCKTNLFSQYYENFSVKFIWRLANEVVHSLNKTATLSTTPSVSKYKQNSLFRFIHLMMYVVHNMDHIHH
jgi:hypothetical protein